jgi:hypothetical protein
MEDRYNFSRGAKVAGTPRLRQDRKPHFIAGTENARTLAYFSGRTIKTMVLLERYVEAARY